MATIEIVLDKDYRGPDILELGSTIDNITDDTVKLRWTNTKDEVRSIARYPKRKFVLYVSDDGAAARAVAIFSKRLKISSSILERAKLVLTDSKAYDWRKFLEELPHASPRHILLQLAADAIRRGKQPNLAQIIRHVFIGGISPVDADVLLRLKSDRFRG